MKKLVVVFLFFFFVSLSLAEAGIQVKTLQNETGAIRVVRIDASSNFEAGYLRGTYLRDDISYSISFLISFIFKGNVGLYEETKKYVGESFYFPPGLEEEMRGMEAALRWTYIPELGRYIEYEDLLVINTAAELYGGTHCSSAGAKGSITEHGRVIVARSLDLDFPPEMHNKTYVEYLKVRDKQLVNIVPLPGMVGVLTGVNATKNTMFEINGGRGERGILINGRLVPDHLSKKPIPWLLLGRVLLEEAGSANEMVELAKKYSVTDPFNPLVADEENFVVLSGNEWGWYPRYPVWDMPIEVYDAIGDKVGEDYIIDINIILTKDGFYHDLFGAPIEDIYALRDGYVAWHDAGAMQLSRVGRLSKEDLFTIARAVYGEAGGYHAVVVDLGQRKILLSRSSQTAEGKIIGGWALPPVELPFEW